MTAALVFDFDGVMLDTETADFDAWRAVYDDLGVELPMARWLRAIGTDTSDFHPARYLIEEHHVELSAEELQRRRRQHLAESRPRLTPLPGVVAWVEDAQRLGLRLAIASSSPKVWLDEYLELTGVAGAFEAVVTADAVDRVKPAPDLYLAALAAIGGDPSKSLALEDSPNGVGAAKAAGLFCVAVPSPMTRGLDFRAADIELRSLADHRLEEVIGMRDGGGTQ